MHRSLFALLTLICLAATPVWAQSPTDRAVNALRADGYERITIQRTLLGRTRVVGERAGSEREIILNGRTGAVMRDYVWEDRGRGSDDDRDRSGDRGQDDDRDDDRDDDSDRGDDRDDGDNDNGDDSGDSDDGDNDDGDDGDGDDDDGDDDD